LVNGGGSQLSISTPQNEPLHAGVRADSRSQLDEEEIVVGIVQAKSVAKANVAWQGTWFRDSGDMWEIKKIDPDMRHQIGN